MDLTDLGNKYTLLCGIEEEFLLLSKDGTLAPLADDVMRQSAEILSRDPNRLQSLRLKIRALDPEPSRTQIEYVSLPVKPEELKDCISERRKLLVGAAHALGGKVLAQSIHPIQSDPNPLVGTHLNISARKGGENTFMTPEEMIVVYNHLWYHLPEFIALSVNTPLYRGQKNNIASNRITNSRVLETNTFGRLEIPTDRPQLVRARYYGRLRYSFRITSSMDERRVITNPTGNRLVDITPRGPSTNIDQDHDESPVRNRIETRIFDTQPQLEVLLDLAYIVCGLTLEALELNKKKAITPDPYHNENKQRAIRWGLDTMFIKDGKQVSARESVLNMLERTQPHREALNLELTSSLAKAEPQITQKHDLKISTNTSQFEELRSRGKSILLLRTGSPRVAFDQRGGRNYRVKRGTRLIGKLSANFRLSYTEEQGLVTAFRDIEIINILKINGTTLPLQDGDLIERAFSEEEYMMSRFLGRSFF
jgi:gamma-glutamyl:cysteine ligase YbdK (ATP-grasp superfamily)